MNEDNELKVVLRALPPDSRNRDNEELKEYVIEVQEKARIIAVQLNELFHMGELLCVL